MSEATNFCWVGADGTLHSGSAQELMRAFVAGALPARHPVWRHGWSEWVLLEDVLAERRLEFEVDAPPTERDLESVPTSPIIDPDVTAEDLTRPLRAVTTTPPALFSQHPPEASQLPPMGGTARTVPPALHRRGVHVPALIGASVGLIGAIAAAGIVGSATVDSHGRALRRAAVSVQLPARASSPRGFACSLDGDAMVVAPRITRGASLHAATVTERSVAVGVNATEKTGLGITLRLGPLELERTEAFADPLHVAGVVPSTTGQFSVDRFTRRAPGREPFSLGMTPSGFTRIGEDGGQTTIWPGEAREVISRPVLAAFGDAGVGVAFRRGDDRRGAVRLGWLDARGQRLSDLATLSVASGLTGEPAVAAGPGRLLVAYAVQQPADAPAAIELALAKFGELPGATRRFDANSSLPRERPAIAALPDGRWLLAWAEGDRERGRRVRAQVLSEELTPSGVPLELASSLHPIGAVALHAAGARLVVLFSERAHRQTETLLARQITCR